MRGDDDLVSRLSVAQLHEDSLVVNIYLLWVVSRVAPVAKNPGSKGGMN